jgi:hypothetical protein
MCAVVQVCLCLLQEQPLYTEPMSTHQSTYGSAFGRPLSYVDVTALSCVTLAVVFMRGDTGCML